VITKMFKFSLERIVEFSVLSYLWTPNLKHE